MAQPDLVLHVGRWLDIPMAKCKPKFPLGSGVERSRIRDRILQGFVHWAENSIHACLPVMLPAMSGEVRAQISFAIAAVLRNNHRRCLCVRTQRGARVAHAPGKT